MVYVDARHDYKSGMGAVITDWHDAQVGDILNGMVYMGSGWTSPSSFNPASLQPANYSGWNPPTLAIPGSLPASPNPTYVDTAIPGMMGTFPVLSLQDAINQHLSFQTSAGIANEVGLGDESVQNLVNDVPAFVRDYCSIRSVPGCASPGGLISDAQNRLTGYYQDFIAAARTQSWNYPGLAPATYPVASSNTSNTPLPGAGNPNPAFDAQGNFVPMTPGEGMHNTNPTSGVVNFTDPQNLGAGSVPVPNTGNGIGINPSSWDSTTWLEVGAVGLVALIGFGMMKSR